MRRGALFLLPLLVATVGCPRPPRSSRGGACASLDEASCRRAQALVLAAPTYADEAHDLILATPKVPSLAGLARAGDGWHVLPAGCARSTTIAPRLDATALDYAFVGVAVDETIVSADADVGPLLARTDPPVHQVRLVALALVRDEAPPSFRPGSSLVETASGACTCGDATHFVGAPKLGAMLAYGFSMPRIEARAHLSALELVRSALADSKVTIHESRLGGLAIDDSSHGSTRDGVAPQLALRVTQVAPVAYAAPPIAELCEFPAPDVSPSPLDFGTAPYGTEARRTVRVVNRAPFELRAIVGASTYRLPANGTIELPLRWTPDGDAPGCETQTRDEAIPFLRPGGVTPRTSRVFETIRTGRATLERRERVAPVDLASSVRDWTCPPDFGRSSCRIEDAVGDVVVEPRGEDACHFACPPGAAAGGHGSACHFDAVMSCALHCAP